MQATETIKEPPVQSQLLDSLRVYLNNKKRLQPIIGLNSIVECVRAGTQTREALYLCDVCLCRLSKTDIRNHIMGSQHRYNYIRVWHPGLVSHWKENAELARPLMEISKAVEEKEGPGHIRVSQVEDSVYQTLAAFTENDAAALIHILRKGFAEAAIGNQSETSSGNTESNQPCRTVLLPEASTHSEGCLDDSSSSAVDNSHMCPDPFWLSESRSSFLSNYTGREPLIGLSRAVECRGEDGQTYCFLCHCCRIRSNNQDFIDHLISSSHLVNYMMETCPEQTEAMMLDANTDYQLLQSLAMTVEQQKGGGELKVVSAPESICVHLAGKSYHWCIKMLSDGQAQTDYLKRKQTIKGVSLLQEGPSVDMETAERDDTVQSEYQKWSKIKQKKPKNTVFQVSLPLTEGPLLLERTSFSMDTLSVSPPYSPPSDLDFTPSPESASESSTAFAPEENLCLNEESSDHSDYASSNQFGHTNRRAEDNHHGDDTYSIQQTYQEGSSETFNKELRNEAPPTQNVWPQPPGRYAEDWASYYASCGWGQWNQSNSQTKSVPLSSYQGWQNYVAAAHNQWPVPPGFHNQAWASYYTSYGQWEGYQSNLRSEAGEGVAWPRDGARREWSSHPPQY